MAGTTIYLYADHIVFDGPLGALREHEHAGLALLIGVDGSFELRTSTSNDHLRVALIPPLLKHELNFHGGRALVLYVDPHVPGYRALHCTAGDRCLTLDTLTPPWERALSAWLERQSHIELYQVAQRTWGKPNITLDNRIQELASAFNQNQWLGATTNELAKRTHLSPSRFTHLFGEQLGAGVQRIKQYYRFKLAVASVAQGACLTTAAHNAGFTDSAHFSRAFSSTFGLSPSKVLLRCEYSLGV